MPRLCLFALLFLLPLVSNAAVPTWKIVPAESSLTFIATQNDAPISGKFTHFNGLISFDPNQLADSHVKIMISLNSLTTTDKDISKTLESSDWFSTKLFPQAEFESNQFTKVGDKLYEAKGLLTIRNKTVPVTLKFMENEYTPHKARMTGSTTISRTAFGIGRGEWTDTKNVKDDVRVEFTVTGVMK